MAEPVTGTARLVEEYLGSTLSAVVKAQGLLSSQLAEFIERVGFEPPSEDEPDAPLRARTFSFEFSRTEVGAGDELVTRTVLDFWHGTLDGDAEALDRVTEDATDPDLSTVDHE